MLKNPAVRGAPASAKVPARQVRNVIGIALRRQDFSEEAVEAALNGDPVAAYHACCYDPVAASVLSLAETKEMVDELFKVQAPLLPQFKHLT